MPTAERWDHTLTRRLRSLVRTAPVHRVEASKASRGRDLGAHDLRRAALRGIDSASEHMGFGYGARRTDLFEAVAPLSTAADIAEISDVVIDSLLNEPNRRLPVGEPCLSYEARGRRAAQRVLPPAAQAGGGRRHERAEGHDRGDQPPGRDAQHRCRGRPDGG